jgi:hypothetical protein
MIFALAMKHSGSLSEQEARACQFPIIGDEDRQGHFGCGAANFAAKNVARMIEKISPQARAVVEWMQPYKMGAGYKRQILWTLNELSNTDKHRFIHIAYWQSGRVNFTLDPARGLKVPAGLSDLDVIQQYDTILKGEAIVARIHRCFFDALQRDAQMNVNIVSCSTVAFDTGDLRGKEVVGELHLILEGITQRIFPPLLKLL